MNKKHWSRRVAAVLTVVGALCTTAAQAQTPGRFYPVSYTHLDVYKRQACIPPPGLPQASRFQPAGGIRLHAGVPPDGRGYPVAVTCLLYTSRCV